MELRPWHVAVLAMTLPTAAAMMACAASSGPRPEAHGGATAPAEADAAPAEAPPLSSEATLAEASPEVAPPEESLGERGCMGDEQCVLTSWACSRCAPCPGGARSRAVLRRTSRSERSECEAHGPGRAAAGECAPCPEVPPDFRDWTDVTCRDGQCVAHGQDADAGRVRWASVPCDALPAPLGDPLQGALSLFEARRAAEGETLRVVAYLLQHSPPCPDCPAGAQCEACLPEHPLVGDIPPGGEVRERASSARVDSGLSGLGIATLDLDTVPLGRRVLLCGQWSQSFDTGIDLIFTMHSGTVLPLSGDGAR